jgi:hypothetical protein
MTAQAGMSLVIEVRFLIASDTIPDSVRHDFETDPGALAAC